MKLRATYQYAIALIGLLIFAIGGFLSKYTAGLTPGNIDFTIKKTVSFLNDKVETGEHLCGVFLSHTTDSLWDSPIHTPEGWEIYIVDETDPIFWTGNQVAIDSVPREPGHHIYKDNAGWNLVVVRSMKIHSAVAVYPLTRTAKGAMEGYSRMDDVPGLNFRFTKNSEGAFALDNYDIHIAFTSDQDSIWDVSILFWSGILLLFISILLVHRAPAWMRLVFIVLIFLLRYLLYKDIIYPAVRSNVLFSPSLYASSFLLPSLGDLILHVLSGTLVLIQLGYLLKRLTKLSVLMRSALMWLVLTGVLFLTDMVFGFLKGLVLDSHISFDVTSLSQIGMYTLIAVAIIGVCLLGISYFLYQVIPCLMVKKWWLPIFILSAVTFWIFQFLDANLGWRELLPTTILILIFTLSMIRKDMRFWRTALLLTLIVSGYVTYGIQSHLNSKEEEYLQIYASKLMANKDLDAENLFLEIEPNLVSEFLKPEDFANFSAKKDQFEKRLRRLYFSGYLDKYDLKVLHFDSLGNNLDESNFYSFEVLNDIYNNNSFPTLGNHFYQIREPAVISGYIAKFENCDVHGHYGNVFILLQPKLIQTSYTYPSLLHRNTDSRIIDLEDYSYALYNDGKLLQQRGNYPYPLRFDKKRFSKPTGLFDSYDHFVSDVNAYSIVVLSKPNRAFLVYSSTFTFLSLFFAASFGFGILLQLLVRKANIKRYERQKKIARYKYSKAGYKRFVTWWGFEQPLLSSRIQLAMIAIVFLGLLISVYFTIKYVEYNYNQRAQEELTYKLKEVANQLQNEVNTGQKIYQEEEKVLLVNQISNAYKVEANIFDTEGFLLASSEPDLYSEGLISRLMDPTAYAELSIKGTSQFIHSERLRTLDYLSAYVPILNEKRKIIAYLNLPYFTRQRELDKEISTYTVTLVNVYLVLFIFALVLAYLVSKRITKPLQLIRDKISQTSLGNKNEMIDWKRNDEIGQLIKQYNKMVLELEESARKLSSSEREGAWKEMARQVAHEIKNPLTPMKLNVQHLQRAWKDEHPKLPETFEKVTRVLIDQIDSLSRLASEFSSFAQMPQNEFQECEVDELLRNVVLLYEKSEHVRFDTDFPDRRVVIVADEEQLKRAFTNIIKNGIQAIPEGRDGVINVSLRIDRNEAVIRISDNGSGIPEDQRKKIFVPNFSTKTSGMGLGLAITKKIIETTGGSITFTSKINQGTTFIIRLPVKSVVETNQ